MLDNAKLQYQQYTLYQDRSAIPTIGNYKTHTVQGKEINDENPYNDLFIDDDPRID